MHHLHYITAMAESVDLSSLAFVRLPAKTLASSDRLLCSIKQTEKRTFPTNEAFDFDSELKKRTTVLHCVYRKQKDGPELCGYAVYIRSKLVTRIHKVCVVERFHGQGIGKWMVDMVLKELKKAAAGSVDLWVDAGRIPARRLYEACGFKEVQVVRDYYSPGRNGIRMQMNLVVEAWDTDAEGGDHTVRMHPLDLHQRYLAVPWLDHGRGYVQLADVLRTC